MNYTQQEREAIGRSLVELGLVFGEDLSHHRQRAFLNAFSLVGLGSAEVVKACKVAASECESMPYVATIIGVARRKTDFEIEQEELDERLGNLNRFLKTSQAFGSYDNERQQLYVRLRMAMQDHSEALESLITYANTKGGAA